MTTGSPWKPARWEQHLVWWLKVLARYVVGVGGFSYEAFIERDPLASVLCVVIATSMDVGQVALTLVRAAIHELRMIEHITRDIEDPDGPPDSAPESKS